VTTTVFVSANSLVATWTPPAISVRTAMKTECSDAVTDVSPR
jgi:hypothetical protein